MDERAMYAAAAVVGGVVVGTVAGWLTRRTFLHRQRPPKLQEVAAPAAIFMFWVALAAGIAVGIGLLAPNTLRPLPGQILAYLPRVLVAGLMLIVGYAAATITSAVLGRGLARATGRTRREASTSLRIAIMIAVLLLALSQLGVDTTILTIAVAALLFGTATALALLIGLGGQNLAREVAAGRYLRRILKPGDHIETGHLTGKVTTLHPATTEFTTDTSGAVHVPHTRLLADTVRIHRPAPGRRPQPRLDGPTQATEK